MKSFSEQEYSFTLAISITIDNFTFQDEIKGLNRGHALYLARLNWPEATRIQDDI